MTEQELSDAIGEGMIENRIQDFRAEAIERTGKQRRCPTVYKAAWKMYVESVKEITPPAQTR
jgi:uncharacterized protein YcfJ